MSVRTGAACLAGAAALVVAPAAAGAPVPVLLPSPFVPLDASVPLGAGSVAPTEVALPRNAHVSSVERVLVGVQPGGEPRSVRVRQRLRLGGSGDFFFVVPAPLLDVRAAPGSEAEPGLRPKGVVWQGFAARPRVLAADAELLPGAAAGVLPLRLDLRATVDGRPLARGERRSGRLALTLRLRNATAVRAGGFDAPARAREVEPVLERIRALARLRQSGTFVQLSVPVRGEVRRRSFVVEAPLRIRGEVRLPAATVVGASARGGSVVRTGAGVALRFAFLLGGPAPSRATIALSARVREAGPPELQLVARPVPELPELRHVEAAGGRELVELANRALLRLARVRQYETFLANPDQLGAREAAYVFRTAASATPRTAPSRSADGGTGPLTIVLATVAATLLVAGSLVLWAHS